jgi:1-acyl-sn-glycerol-3-phosphate acyltransferase
MPPPEYTIAYPRKRIARSIARVLGRIVLPITFRVQITGRENFPARGPLLVVGNHTAVMEAVLMAVYTPWQVETLGAADVPHERVTQLAISFFGFIPINRGHVDRPALTKALDALKQDGVVGIFPEGGIWETGARRAQTGVAWLSYRGNAPILPIGYSGTLGALSAALRLKRPQVAMNVGPLIPPASPPPGKPRKVYLETFATQVMDAVNALLPADDPALQARQHDERFELQVSVHRPDGTPGSYPADQPIRHQTALAKLLHRPAVLKIFKQNLRLPIGPLQNLDSEHDAGKIADATRSALDYLKDENPYLLTYRFGPKEAEAMHAGLQELLALAQWASASSLSLTVTPIRSYRLPDGEEEIVQIKQGTFEHWM